MKILAHTQTLKITEDSEEVLVDYPNDVIEVPDDTSEGDILEEYDNKKSILKQIKSVFV